MLTTANVFLLDSGTELFVWWGKQAPKEDRTAGRQPIQPKHTQKSQIQYSENTYNFNIVFRHDFGSWIFGDTKTPGLDTCDSSFGIGY